MRKLFLKSGTAYFTVPSLVFTGLALASLGLCAPAFAHGRHHNKPVARPVSQAFDSQSHRVAAQTVTVAQTGTPDIGYASQYAPQGQDVEQVVAMTAAPPIVACQQGTMASPEWQQVPEELRRNAIPGQCFSRLIRAPKVESYRERVLVQAERVESRTIPEVVEMVEQDVVVQPERVMRRVVPAVSHVEMATEIVRPASYREETLPARYENRTEHVMVRDARREWVRSDGIRTEAAMLTPDDYQPMRARRDGTLSWPGKDGEPMPLSRESAEYMQQDAQGVWCLKVVPGVYEDRVMRVEVSPASVRRIEIPAETRQVRRTVIDVPEHYEDVTVPAVRETRRVRRVVREARTENYTVPAVYDDVVRQRVSGQAEPMWREVICGKNTSTQKIMEVQRALAARGYQPGAIDGQLGPQTVAAMQKFQADNGLPQGQPSVEAVRLLGVPLVPLSQN